MKANFRLYSNKTSSGYGKEMDTWIKEDKMEQKREEEEDEMVKWIQWREREADWELIPIR